MADRARAVVQYVEDLPGTTPGNSGLVGDVDVVVSPRFLTVPRDDQASQDAVLCQPLVPRFLALSYLGLREPLEGIQGNLAPLGRGLLQEETAVVIDLQMPVALKLLQTMPDVAVRSTPSIHQEPRGQLSRTPMVGIEVSVQVEVRAHSVDGQGVEGPWKSDVRGYRHRLPENRSSSDQYNDERLI